MMRIEARRVNIGGKGERDGVERDSRIDQTEDWAGADAWEVARRTCTANKRELIPRAPHWLFQNDEKFKKGNSAGYPRFTILGIRLDVLKMPDMDEWEAR